jgi:hypothetical protein
MMDTIHEQLETLVDFPTGAWPAHVRKAIIQGIDSSWHQFQIKRRASTITFRAPRLRSWGALLRLAQDELTGDDDWDTIVQSCRERPVEEARCLCAPSPRKS